MHGHMHPRNVLLSKRVRRASEDTFGVRLKTFGLRSHCSRDSSSSSLDIAPQSSHCASHLYLAPEALCFTTFSSASDMFGYVLLLHFLLHDHHPSVAS